MTTYETQQVLATEAWKKAAKVEGLSLRTLTAKQLQRLSNKYDLTENESFGAGFAGAGKYEVFRTDGGTIAVAKR